MGNFLKRFILDPLDDAWFSYVKIMEYLGWHEKVNSRVYKNSVVLVGNILRTLYNFKVENAEYIPDEGRVIHCINHQSELDVVAFGIAAGHGKTKRHLHQMAKIELFKIPLINGFIRTHFAFPLNWGGQDILAFRHAKELLENEEMLGIYPEGTTNPGMGRFLEGRLGAVRLAYETNSPILPVAIFGTDMIYGKGAKFPRFSGNIILRYGKLMNYQQVFGDLESEDPKFYKKAINRVMRRIQDIYFQIFQEQNEKAKKGKKIKAER